MGLERVIEEILAAGEEQRRKILSDGEAEKQKILASARTEADSVKKVRSNELERRSSLMKQQSLSSAELEAKKRLLQEQNALLAQVKSDTLRSLSELDADARKDLLGKLCKIASKELAKGVLHCRKEDEKLVAAPSGFKKVADMKTFGGVIAESDDGNFRMDLSFEALLEDIWNRDVQKVYVILFGGA